MKTLYAHLFSIALIATILTLAPKLASADNNLHYGGGPVVGQIFLIPVLWGPNVDKTVAANIEPFFNGLLNADCLSWLDEYNVGLAYSKWKP
jgi:hypothetical protein